MSQDPPAQTGTGIALVGGVQMMPDATVNTTIKNEHAEDRKARLEQEALNAASARNKADLDATSERRKNEFKFYGFWIVYVLTFGIAIWVSFFATVDSSIKEKAFSLVSLIIGSIGGFLVGKKETT